MMNQENYYSKMLSSALTTELTTTHAPLDKFEETGGALSMTKQGIYKKGDMLLELSDLDILTAGLTPRAYKLFDAIIIQFGIINNFKDTENLNRRINFTLDGYIEAMGRSDSKASKDKIRIEIKEDLKLMEQLSLEWKTKGVRGYARMRLISGHAMKNGQVSVNLTDEFAQYINTQQLMYYPTSLLKISTRRPLNYYLGRKLATHYAIRNNQNRGTHNIIRVQTLLDGVAGSIPSYEEVMSTNRNVTDRIVKPFEKALNELQVDGIITWQYTGAKHKPLDDTALYNNDYNIFTNKMVSFELLDYPPSDFT